MKLLIVGSGPVLPKLETLRDELGIAADCVFEPSQTEVAPWLRALDIYVMSSETESFPNALLEARGGLRLRGSWFACRRHSGVD